MTKPLKIIKPRLQTLSGRTVQLPPKQASPHYLTPEHVKWSAEVRKRAGYQCEKCGRQGERMFADHIVELKDGGSALDLANGMCLCGACHTRKTLQERAKRL